MKNPSQILGGYGQVLIPIEAMTDAVDTLLAAKTAVYDGASLPRVPAGSVLGQILNHVTLEKTGELAHGLSRVCPVPKRLHGGQGRVMIDDQAIVIKDHNKDEVVLLFDCNGNFDDAYVVQDPRPPSPKTADDQSWMIDIEDPDNAGEIK